MTSPAEGDHTLYLDHLRVCRDEVADGIASYRERLRRLADTKRSTSLAEQQMAVFEITSDRISRVMSHATEAWNTDHSLGNLVQSSGIEQPATGNGLMDWAVIQPSARLLPGNHHAQKVEEIVCRFFLSFPSFTRGASFTVLSCFRAGCFQSNEYG